MPRTARISTQTAAALMGVVAVLLCTPAIAQTADPSGLTLEGAAPPAAPAGQALPTWMQYSDHYGKKPVDLSQAHLANEEIESWTQERVTDALSFAPATVGSKVTSLRALFSDAGWAAYAKVLGQLQVVDNVRTQNMTMATIANGEVNVINTSADGGNFRWQLRVPIMYSMTTPTGAAAGNTNHTLDVIVMRAGAPAADQAGEQPLHNDLKIDSIAVVQAQ